MKNENSSGIIGEIVKVDLDRCNGCLKCIRACTVRVFEKFETKTMQGTAMKVRPAREEECFFCLLCELACPLEAIEIKSYYSSGDTLKALLDY
ncbi:MAG: 4Fe-4S dicluster domain-containing protein [Candidatus Helarchaeota archaeon]